MTSQQAFLELINNKRYLATLPYDERKTIASYRSLYKSKKLKAKNIDTLLKKHKYQLIMEAQWDKVKIKK